MLTKLHLTQNNQIPFPGEFNFLFSVKVEIYGQNPVFSFCQKNIRTKKKKKIWQIYGKQKILKQTNILVLRQKPVSGFLQGRLGYFLISNNIQELKVDNKTILAISSDHSLILFSFSKEKQKTKIQGLGSLTRRVTDFKSLRLNCWDITQAI